MQTLNQDIHFVFRYNISHGPVCSTCIQQLRGNKRREDKKKIPMHRTFYKIDFFKTKCPSF